MKINILASGSSGNCIALTSNSQTILIDAGIAKTKIEKRLLDVGIRPDTIVAIFITHAHRDHTKGLPLANKFKIPVYASEGEWKLIDLVDEELRNIIEPWGTVNFEDKFYIESFATHHDSYESLGYAIQDYERIKCSICLDTGHVDDAMIDVMAFSQYYIIESNHEPRMVEVSQYPNSVKARIVSDIGHLSNEQTAAALTKLVNGVGEHIYLTHLSSSNNLPGLAEMTTKRALLKKGFREGKHYYLEVHS